MANKLYIKKNGQSITILDEQDIQSRIDNVEIPTKTSDLTNDSGFLTVHQDISGKEDRSNKSTSLNSQSTHTQYPTSKTLYDALQNYQLESEAFSGDYNDLTNKPTIPTIDIIRIVTDKGTASADTMNKFFIETKNNKTDIYYTEDVTGNYAWHKLDTEILDDLSINWSDIQNKPSVEVIENKVTSLSSSSTNTQYPSAKAVFDAIDDLITVISDETEATNDGIYFIEGN